MGLAVKVIKRGGGGGRSGGGGGGGAGGGCAPSEAEIAWEVHVLTQLRHGNVVRVGGRGRRERAMARAADTRD